MSQNNRNCGCSNITDFGPEPFVTNINNAARQNCNFRAALWTGSDLQCILESIPCRSETGPEIFSNADQFICVQEGCGCVMMGSANDRLNFQTNVSRDTAICVPAGTWCNLVNTGSCPLKCFTIFAPPQFPSGTVQRTAAGTVTERRFC